jgi:hypothetical protein
MKRFTNSNSAQMSGAVTKVYGMAEAVVLENIVCQLARKFSTEYDGGSWEFVADDEEGNGFWFPSDRETYTVEVPSNYYRNGAMPAVAFGAGLTLVAVNMLAWQLNEAGNDVKAALFSNKYHALFNMVFDLSESEGDFVDGVAVAGFID